MRQYDLRQFLGLSLKEFADRIGVHKDSAGRYEHGRVPTESVMRRILVEFNGIITPNDYYDLYLASSADVRMMESVMKGKPWKL